jgi:hypothetical protein
MTQPYIRHARRTSALLQRGALRLGLLLALCVGVSACESEPRNHEFSLQTVGGPDGWPVWVETLTFNGTWSGPNGDLLEGFGQHPPHSGTYSFGAPLPAPQTMQARWFSYRTQTFYEIDLALPDTLESLPQWYRDYPLSKFHHALTVGLSGHGEVQVGWHAWCRNCTDRSEDFHIPIVSTAHGQEVEGTTDRYHTRTQAFVDQGVFPTPW